jgi:hypothetical protein
MRTLTRFLAGVLTVAVVVFGAAFIFLKTGVNGFSARAQPSAFETMAAQNREGHGASIERQGKEESGGQLE